jgi:hypothetical protein
MADYHQPERLLRSCSGDLSGVEGVPQPVADGIDAQDSERNHETRHDGSPGVLMLTRIDPFIAFPSFYPSKLTRRKR